MRPNEDLKAASELAATATAARDCQNCPLYANATQTVFGLGPVTADLALVGEQPGDEEDREGVPFIGPAGRLLRKALGEAHIDPHSVYLTNAVKHFKWKQGSGWKRLHQKPNRREIGACLPWLEKEMSLIQPKLIVALGATPAQALLGSQVRVTRDRGNIGHWNSHRVFITVHPSSILRARDQETRRRQYSEFLEDLTEARLTLAGS